MGRYDGAKKPVIIACIIVIIMCLIPWWSIFMEINVSDELTYLALSVNPFYSGFAFLGALIGNDSGWWAILLSGSAFSFGTGGHMAYLIAVIVSLIGAIIGIIGMGKKNITIVAGLLVLAGALLYMLFLYMGFQLTGVDMTFFTDNGVNPMWGTYTDTTFDIRYTFGISIGCIVTLITGVVILFLSAKAND